MRLIDADALEPDAEYDDGEFWAVSMRQIENAPTIEPKRGRWILRNADSGFHTDCICSECKSRHAIGWDFCPNCGADMREGDEK